MILCEIIIDKWSYGTLSRNPDDVKPQQTIQNNTCDLIGHEGYGMFLFQFSKN